MSLGITFLGGAQTVTGSKFLLGVDGKYVLIDCGMFQGVKELRLQNWQNLPVDPRAIHSVILTHAHLDHTGYLPLIAKKGFRGSIYCTPPTRAITELVLLDAAHIQEEDTLLALKGGYTKHPDAKPLFDTSDVKQLLPFFSAMPLLQWREIFPHFKFRFVHSGHILGSSFVEIDYRGTRLVFTGDLGRKKPLLLRSPEVISQADYLIVESTYGDRKHPTEPVQRSLARIVQETYARGGDLIIPSFAVGRTQDLLFLFSDLKRRKQIPNLPVYVDSPMGIEATKIFYHFSDWHKLGVTAVRAMEECAVLVPDRKGSDLILKNKKPKIVIAGSGMVTGGRVLEHLKKALPNEKNTVLLVGFQAAGTRGRQIRDGMSEIKMHGAYYPNRAHVEEITGLSAHADQPEMISWLRNFPKKPKNVFIVHGEPQAADALRVKIEHTLGWSCSIPKQYETFPLELKKKK